MKVTIKTIKQWLAFILTFLVALTLFAIIFIKAGIVQPSPNFFLELSIVLLLSVLMKVWWVVNQIMSEDMLKSIC